MYRDGPSASSREPSPPVSVEEGFGRTDALGRIANNVFATNLDPQRTYGSDAPVSYPPVWNAWKFDWVQYTASVAQPLARNIGESLGTGAQYYLLDRYGKPVKVPRAVSKLHRCTRPDPHRDDAAKTDAAHVERRSLRKEGRRQNTTQAKNSFRRFASVVHGPYYSSCSKWRSRLL